MTKDESSVSGLSVLPSGLMFEYIDQNESDFLYDEIFIRNVYRIKCNYDKLLPDESHISDTIEKRNGSNKIRKTGTSTSTVSINVKLETPTSHEILTEDSNQFYIELKDNDVVLDVGANIGLFSLYCQLQAKNIEVYAIEPLPPISAVLKRNLYHFSKCKLGQLSQSRSQSIPFGITNIQDQQIGDNPTAAFYYFGSQPAESTRHLEEWSIQQTMLRMYLNEHQYKSNDIENVIHVLPESLLTNTVTCNPNGIDLPCGSDAQVRLQSRSQYRMYECPVCSLKYLIHHYSLSQINILKIDAEGDELNILLSLGDDDSESVMSQENNDSTWGIIKQIVVEVHDIDGRLHKVKSLLHRKGYKVSDCLQKGENHYNYIWYLLFALKL